MEGVLWNSSAWFDLVNKEKENEEDPNIYTVKGNNTEMGIFNYLMSATDGDACVAKKEELTEDKIQCIIPFTSRRKMGSIVIRVTDKIGTDKEIRIYTKGAPDFLLEKCSYSATADGTIKEMDAATTVPTELNVDVDGVTE